MNKRGYFYSIAIFLSLLIICIPFYAASAYAGIAEVKVSGEDEIEGFVKQRDAINYEVYVDSATPIAAKQIVLKPNTAFATCAPDIGYYKCTLRFPADGTMIFNDVSQYTIEQYDNRSRLLDSYPGTLYVDKLPPKVTTLSLSPQRTTGKVTVSYSVTDYGVSGKCSGISKVELYSGEDIFHTETIDSPRCSYSGKFDYILTGDGDHELCLRAYDRFSHVSDKKCGTVTVDSTAPEFTDYSINDRNGKPIKFVRNRNVNAVLLLNITSLDTKEVWADLSSLNPALKNVTADKLTPRAGVLTAEWDFTIKIRESTDGNILLGITDETGNVKLASIVWPIALDVIGPEFKSITSDKSSSSGFYITSSPTTIIADITEAGIGLNETQIYLDFSQLGLGVKPADYCDAGWICYWKNIVSTLPDNAPFSLSAGTQSTDILGNPLKSTFSANFVSFSSFPDVYGFNYSPAYPTSVDTLQLNFNVSDKSGIASVKINASEISTDASLRAAECSEVDTGKFTCQASVSALANKYIQGKIGIIVTSSAGNTAISYQKITVYKSDSTTDPNFFSVASVETLPSRIDRRTLSQVQMPFFIHPILNGDAQILSSTVTCDSTYLATPTLLKDDSKDPFISTKLSQSLAELPSVQIKCTLSLHVKDKTRVYSKPEKEDIIADVGLYNIPLGSIGDQAQEKINDLDDDIASVEDKIAKLEKWNNILSMIASIVEMIATIDSILNSIKAVLFWMVYIPATSGAWVALCGYVSTFHQFVINWIWPPGMVPGIGGGGGVGWLVKLMVFLYTCRLCDASTYVGIATEFANLGATAINTAVDKDSKGSFFKGNSIKNRASETMKDAEVAPVDSEVDMSLTDRPEDKVTANKVGDNKWTVTSGGKADKTTYSDSEINSKLHNYNWGQRAQRTTTAMPPDDGQWIFNPYKSIHYAYGCLCMPGIIYNLKKEKQIYCRQKTCVEETSKVGVPSTGCDTTAKEMMCLYVDSAQYKLHGFSQIWDRLMQVMMNNIVNTLGSFVYTLACYTDFIAPLANCNQAKSAYSAWCGVAGTAFGIMEIADAFNGDFFDFNKYDAALKGTDYCGDEKSSDSGGMFG